MDGEVSNLDGARVGDVHAVTCGAANLDDRANAVAVDGDGAGDVDGTLPAGIQRQNDTAAIGLGVRPLERQAGRCKKAVIGIVA